MQFSFFDKILHELAFISLGVQKMVADVENDFFSKRLACVDAARPVFIASLPRCGTTILLESMVATGRFASQTYQNMPFPLCPMLWPSNFNRSTQSRESMERYHRDGIHVSLDSPEGFEEVLWRSYFPKYYTDDGIKKWPENGDSEFRKIFEYFMKKVIYSKSCSMRYISKNNANISRIPLITNAFPSSLFIIPFRNFDDHIGSILAQGDNFKRIDKMDRFYRRYIDYLAHFEFGPMFKPFLFSQELVGRNDISSVNFLATYWATVFEALLSIKTNVGFINYDLLCSKPRQSLESMMLFVNENIIDLTAQDLVKYRPGKVYAKLELPAALRARLWNINAKLEQRALNR